MMAENDIGAVVVMEAGKLVGMLTFPGSAAYPRPAANRTARRANAADRRDPRRRGDATEPPITSPDMDVDELRRLMVTTHTRYLPVMDGDTLMCVISFHDVAKAVLEERNFENKLLRPTSGLARRSEVVASIAACVGVMGR